MQRREIYRKSITHSSSSIEVDYQLRVSLVQHFDHMQANNNDSVWHWERMRVLVRGERREISFFLDEEKRLWWCESDKFVRVVFFRVY